MFLVRLLFGCCLHKRYSFPMNFSTTHHYFPADEVSSTNTYVVCLQCGKEFPYDWEQMTLSDFRKRKRNSSDYRYAN
jgi:hypothetical protein